MLPITANGSYMPLSPLSCLNVKGEFDSIDSDFIIMMAKIMMLMLVIYIVIKYYRYHIIMIQVRMVFV